MRIVISQPMFFPWVGMFEQIKCSDIFINYNDVKFSKGSLTNRVKIKAKGGDSWLTVPIVHHALDQKINKMEISNHFDWQKKHIELLKKSYQDAPYYSEMLALVDKVYSRDYTTIDEVSHASVLAVCEYFDLIADTEFVDIDDLSISGKGSKRVLDIVESLDGTDYITGHGAKNYLNHESFEESGISVLYMNYLKLKYEQLYGDFTPFVSILDLIAMKGKEGSAYIKSTTINWRQFVNE